MMAHKIKDWAVLFDLDETLVLTSAIEPLRRKPWARAYAAFNRTRLPDGTLEFVEAISQKTLVGVVTKAPRQYAEKLLSYHHINMPVLAAYHDVDNVKPDPEALLLATEKLGIDPSRCIYVGDDKNDVQAARAAKITPLGVRWGNQVDIGLTTICTSWDEVYDEIVRLISE